MDLKMQKTILQAMVETINETLAGGDLLLDVGQERSSVAVGPMSTLASEFCSRGPEDALNIGASHSLIVNKLIK
jgi:hypothetical protein